MRYGYVRTNLTSLPLTVLPSRPVFSRRCVGLHQCGRIRTSAPHRTPRCHNRRAARQTRARAHRPSDWLLTDHVGAISDGPRDHWLLCILPGSSSGGGRGSCDGRGLAWLAAVASLTMPLRGHGFGGAMGLRRT
jgi:hypothetical protein